MLNTLAMSIAKILIFFVGVCPLFGWASYRFYFINNSELTLTYHAYIDDTTPSCAPLSKDYYQNFSGTAKPFSKTQIFDINYDKGIIHDTNYCFKFDVTPVKFSTGETLTILTNLVGDYVGSSIQSAILKTSHSEYRLIHHKPNPNNVQLDVVKSLEAWGIQNLHFYAASIHYPFSNQSTNEVNYVLDAPLIRMTRNEDENSLTLGTYNVQLWPLYAYFSPIRLNQPNLRATLIPHKIKNYDVVVVEELMDKNYRDQFVEEMSREYPYQYGPLHTIAPLSGGTMIFSHWPILKAASAVFQDCSGIDCGAAKGVLYVHIQKGSRFYHIFGTHTQAIEGSLTKLQDIRARDRQFEQMKLFITQQNIPVNQPVVLAGDLNVDAQECFNLNRCEEYQKTITEIGLFNDFWDNRSILPYGEDPTINLMNTSDHGEMDDYIFPLKKYLRPLNQMSRIRVVRAPNVADMYGGGDLLKGAPYGELDLSDHFLLESQLIFPKSV